MKAMIFAAGLGTRLKPFTDAHPKALAEVCGRPMLALVIEKLKRCGVNEFVVNVHHFADQIVDYLHDNDDFGVTVHISDERDCLLDTGGGILAARQWLDRGEDFIVHNADILTDFDVKAMMRSHVDSRSDATLLVADRQTSRYLVFDRDDAMMRGWTNIQTGQTRPDGFTLSDDMRLLAFGGVHIISPKIFPCLEQFASRYSSDCIKPKFSIMDFYIDACSHLQIQGFQPTGQYLWHDIGKPQSLSEAEEDYKTLLK